MIEDGNLSDIQITTDIFRYKGIVYPFTDISHIRFARMEKTTYVVPIKIYAEQSAGLIIELKSGLQIKFVEKPGWIHSTEQKKVDRIASLYAQLSQATFQARLSRYLSDANQRGYFIYSGYKFYPDRRVIAKEDKEFSTENTSFMRAYNYIELRPKNYGFIHKLKRELSWSPKINAIDTLTDTDVIFAIFDHFYGMRWA